MSEKTPDNQPIAEDTPLNGSLNWKSQKGMLGDEQRVRVLSPGMMVFKRFIRNRLAITGLIILIVMFSFSFIGGLFSPYRQDQTFFSTESMLKEYAGATRNSELRVSVVEGETFDRGAYAHFILALNNGEPSFSSAGKSYTYTAKGENLYIVEQLKPLVDVTVHKVLFAYSPVGSFIAGKEFKSAFEAAYKAKENEFDFDSKSYVIVRNGNEVQIGETKNVALISMNIFDTANQSDKALIDSYPFRLAAEEAISTGAASFSVDSANYVLVKKQGGYTVNRLEGTQETRFADISGIIVNAISPDVFLTLEFKDAAKQAIEENAKSFVYGDISYTVSLVHQTYAIKSLVDTHVFDMYHRPDAKHFLGTDQNGMDVLTRLMYGGRISLMVGFVVVLLEILIGVVIGGISGYFGGWVDTLLMRFIDLFNCIPTWPILIITGSVMDTLEMNPYLRVFLLMFLLGLLGWTGIARVVRGQILALREQDFMVATEATGIRISRRIGKHLVPNVMPLLIVQATMGLGGIILTEATLSFLGLGIKHPLASWGSIINAASNPYVMTNYWFIWLPAGLLILLTVLGFNFVGDGLRDAFDPKMKR